MRSKNTGAHKALETVIHLIFLLCGIVAVGFVLVISVYLIISGLPAIRQIGLFRFLFGQVWDPTNTTTGAQYGILPFILTSIYGTAGAMVIGVPIGLMTAIFLAKLAPPRAAAVIRTAVQLLAGIPSVVYGLVGMIVLVPLIRTTFSLGSGACLLAAILVLSIMVLPSIINVSETALRAVPREYEEASLALGATAAETYFRVSLHAARSGVATAVVLGVGRAIGEAMAIIMVAGVRGGACDRRGHGHHDGGRQCGQYAGAVPVRPVPHHRHHLRHVLCPGGQPVSAGPVLHRPGAVPVHYAHQRISQRVHQKAEGGLTHGGKAVAPPPSV